MRLPVVLENLRIASPCNADWDEMSGDDKARFCGQCERDVYNLSAMTRAEAEALVAVKTAATPDRLCLRWYQRSDGTVITADCPVGAERRRLRHRVWSAISGAMASAALLVGLGVGRARADVSVSDDGSNGNKTVKQPPQNLPIIHAPVMGGAVAQPPPAPPPPNNIHRKMGGIRHIDTAKK